MLILFRTNEAERSLVYYKIQIGISGNLAQPILKLDRTNCKGRYKNFITTGLYLIPNCPNDKLTHLKVN